METTSLFVRIFNDTTLEVVEFTRAGRSATTIERNAVRWAYRHEFIQKGDRYHVELWTNEACYKKARDKDSLGA